MIRQETVSLGGHDFHLRRSASRHAPGETGERPRLLLLHGFPEYSGGWEELMTALPDHECIAPDQRGYGQSWAPAGVSNYRGGLLAGDMARLIETIGGPMVVVGHDWGAAVAYALAIRRPDLVSHLVILNGVHPACFQRALAAGGAQARASQYINWLRADGSEDRLVANDFEKLLALFSADMNLSWLSGARLAAYKTEWSRPGRLRAMVDWYRASPLSVAAPGQRLDLPQVPPEAARIAMPHLVIWGAADTALLPEARAGLDAYAPDLTIRTIPDADHWLHHTHAETVARLLTDWLSARGVAQSTSGS